MKLRNDVLFASFESDDVATLVRRVVASRREFSVMPADVAANLSEHVIPTSTWLDDALTKFDSSLYASWPGSDDPAYPLLAADRHRKSKAGTVQVHLRVDWTPFCVVEYATSVGAVFAVFDDYFHGNATWKTRRGIEVGHVDLGWGCLFVGERGHERLVSRRWLEYGPWWLRRFPGDVSLVQFHDLDADADTALAQATPGHRRMSDHEIGGWLRSSYRPVSSYKKEVSEFRALYVPDDQSLRVVCMPGRDITQAELLDACAERLVARYNPDKPVRSLRYVFIDPRDAERNLHELWLRDIEVWAIVGSNEVRLDADYRPTPTPPEWVRLAQERGDQ